LARYLSKLDPHNGAAGDREKRVKFAQEALIKMSERLQLKEFMHELRLLYSYENWMTLMINVNLTFSNVVFASGHPLQEGILKANQDFGSIFSEELKRVYLSPSQRMTRTTAASEISSKELLKIFDQLSRFNLQSYSIVKEFMYKLFNI
jgi:hypothetical protein